MADSGAANIETDVTFLTAKLLMPMSGTEHAFQINLCHQPVLNGRPLRSRLLTVAVTHSTNGLKNITVNGPTLLKPQE